MFDPATFKRYAEECRRLAATSTEEQQPLLLEHAAAWSILAKEVEVAALDTKKL
jgi:hypothetical protein